MDKIRIGDIVRFISDKIEGKVTSVTDNTTVNVYCKEYGFEIPASVDDLVVVKTGERQTASAGREASNLPKIDTETNQNLQIAVVPKDRKDTFEIFLVNDSPNICLYHFSVCINGRHKSISSGTGNPGTLVSIGEYTAKEIDTISSFKIQAILYKKGEFIPRMPIDKDIKISTATLYKTGAYIHTKWFPSPVFIRSVEEDTIEYAKDIASGHRAAVSDYTSSRTDSSPDKTGHSVSGNVPRASRKTHIRKSGQSQSEQDMTEKRLSADTLEFDLHINALLDDTTGMNNRAILEYQLNVFRSAMEKYRLKTGFKLIFIHGKGDGVLKQRILWELKTAYKRHRHQDASFKQYGYGATMVIIK